jgi:hypothetical protein
MLKYAQKAFLAIPSPKQLIAELTEGSPKKPADEYAGFKPHSGEPEPYKALKYWRLTQEKLDGLGISRFSSGQFDEYTVCIRWSDKLGLSHPHVFNTRDEAEAFLDRVAAATHIQPDLWEKHFHPGRNWENSQYVD